MTSSLTQSLSADALQIRRKFLRMHFKAKAGHLGTGLSCIDILTYFYRQWLRPVDTFILSKGHGASALYATLHQVGLLSDEDLATYYEDGTLLPAHPAAGAHPAIRAATGSLGHGLPIAAGIAYSEKHLKQSGARVACLLSDGECNEGTIWEAAMFAAHHQLGNLSVVVDANGLQGFGRTEDVMQNEPFAAKWQAFGFATVEVNGHDFDALHAALAQPSDRPTCVIARTVKGKGASFMENRLEWHYLPMNSAQLEQALRELDALELQQGLR